jgi:uncharacterized protein YfdQ (DUF2303 family)
MAERTDNDALIATAQAAVEPTSLTRGELVAFATSPHVVDLEQYAGEPHRKRGQVTVTDTASLITYVKKHAAGGATELYALWDHGRVVAVINGHDTDDPGWGDHRVSLALQATPAWTRWTSQDGAQLTQTAFAEHIEDSLAEIVEPAAATMLEIAQSFQAHTSVAFRSGRRLHTGETKLVYEEQTDATAGAQGDITIPETFTIALAPWEGCDPYRMNVRLRYRIGNGDLKLSYRLDRPEDVRRAAFADITTAVADATGYTALAGSPPGAS